MELDEDWHAKLVGKCCLQGRGRRPDGVGLSAYGKITAFSRQTYGNTQSDRGGVTSTLETSRMSGMDDEGGLGIRKAASYILLLVLLPSLHQLRIEPRANDDVLSRNLLDSESKATNDMADVSVTELVDRGEHLLMSTPPLLRLLLSKPKPTLLSPPRTFPKPLTCIRR
jgi:hypothetical protein